jgi:hypothetical protein
VCRSQEIFGEKGGEAEDGSHPGPHTSPGMGISALQSCREQGVVIDPRGVFRTWWDMLSIILVIWIALFLPYRLAFDIGEQAALGVLDLFIDIFFIVDVGLNMITGEHADSRAPAALTQRHSAPTTPYARTRRTHTILPPPNAPHPTHPQSRVSTLRRVAMHAS